MPPKQNPAKLNPLQLRTLTLLQVMARIPGNAKEGDDGALQILQFPHAHGDHFHLGDFTVMSRDATGLENPQGPAQDGMADPDRGDGRRPGL